MSPYIWSVYWCSFTCVSGTTPHWLTPVSLCARGGSRWDADFMWTCFYVQIWNLHSMYHLGQRPGLEQLQRVRCEDTVVPPADWVPVPPASGGKPFQHSSLKAHLSPPQSTLPVCSFRFLSLWLMWRRCRRFIISMPVWTQRSAPGESPASGPLWIYFDLKPFLPLIGCFLPAGGWGCVFDPSGRKQFPWHWRWRQNRAGWSSQGHSSGISSHC